MTEQESFQLELSKIENLKRAMYRELEADLFKDNGRAYPVIPAPRWYRRWAWLVRRYFSTLWLAIKGVELEEPSELE